MKLISSITSWFFSCGQAPGCPMGEISRQTDAPLSDRQRNKQPKGPNNYQKSPTLFKIIKEKYDIQI